MDMNNRICCFFGHRNLRNEERENIASALKRQIRSLIITDNVKTFLFSGYGDFDRLCKGTVDSLKIDYPQIERALVQSYYKYDDKEYSEYLYRTYDSIIYPEIENRPKKLAIIYCNRAMVDMSDYCVFLSRETMAEHIKRFGTRTERIRVLSA